MAKWKSIITSNHSKCYLCGKQNIRLEKHHIMNGTAYRPKAEQDGLYVMLCTTHEEIIGKNKNGSYKTRMVEGCHEFETTHPKENQLLKSIAKDKWMEYYHKTEDDWIERYGKSYENDS